jgi:hypothetical protein
MGAPALYSPIPASNMPKPDALASASFAANALA